jgi:cytochrome c556
VIERIARMLRSAHRYLAKTIALFGFLVVVACGSLAHAQADVIAERQKLMKEIGDGMKALAPVFKGTEALGEKAEASARLIEANFSKARDLFPAGSTSNDSDAMETIWSENAGFLTGFDKAEESAAAVVAATARKEDAEFKAALAELGQTCKSCHEKYRKPSN